MYKISNDTIDMFCNYLKEQERSASTIHKYIHDITLLREYADGEIQDKEHLVGFRKYLENKEFASRSINSMLTAINCFMKFLGCDWRLHSIRVQRQNFTSPEKELTREEYGQMVHYAEEMGNSRLAMMVQTLCATGIRISELKFITAESLAGGTTEVNNKGKIRTILLPDTLVKKLNKYCMDKGIASGPIFITRTGKPMDRSNIWRMLKRLAELANVAKKKAFPHNLRHLFARTYYKMFPDPIRLADILGHSSLDTTRIYTANSGREERIQIARLGLVI